MQRLHIMELMNKNEITTHNIHWSPFNKETNDTITRLYNYNLNEIYKHTMIPFDRFNNDAISNCNKHDINKFNLFLNQNRL